MTTVLVDLSEAEAPDTLVAAAGGRIDILVNNVGGVTPRTGRFLQVTDEQWLASMNVDLMVAERTTRSALPLMLEAGHGTIVIVASVNSFLPDPLVIDYSAAKAALAKAQAVAGASHGTAGTWPGLPPRSR